MTAPSGRARRGIALAIAAAATLAVALAGSAAADPPPWQQAGNVNNDPNETGTLAFYDATGTQIFSGSVSDTPFAAFVVGSSALRDGDTAAALYAYLPDAGTPAGAWTGSLLTAASAYPNAAAPGSLATAAPAASLTNADVSLADFITGHPNTSADAGYAGIYEVRLRTSGDGRSATPTYDAADLRVTGDTWQVVYPAHFTDTTTDLAVAPPTGLHAGATVTLTATISASDATGSVTFTDGATTLGTVPVAAGTAAKSVKITKAGSHTFHATYVPASGSTYAGSVGTQTVSVAKATTTTIATWPTGTLHYGTKFTVKAAVTAAGITPTGTVSVKYGTKTLAATALAAGKATLTVPATALLPGKRALTVSYGGSADTAGSSTAAKTVTIAKAVSTTTNSLVSRTVSRTQHAKLSVHVTAAGTTPSGTVTVYDGSTKIATGTLSGGRVTVTLPRLSRVGTHKIHARYGGSSLVAASSAASVTLTVKR